MKPTSKIKRWMFANIAEFIDPETGEINCTQLAEAACDALNGYDGNDIPDEYFETAFDVGQGIIYGH